MLNISTSSSNYVTQPYRKGSNIHAITKHPLVWPASNIYCSTSTWLHRPVEFYQNDGCTDKKGDLINKHGPMSDLDRSTETTNSLLIKDTWKIRMVIGKVRGIDTND